MPHILLLGACKSNIMYWDVCTELMLLGFVSLLLTVFQDAISHICMPTYLGSFMLPCKRQTVSHKEYSHGAVSSRRQLLSIESGWEHCANKVQIMIFFYSKVVAHDYVDHNIQ